MADISMTEVDLTALTREQLERMVDLRGRALVAYLSEDNRFRDKIARRRLAIDDIQKMFDAKEKVLIALGEAELSLFHPSAPATRN